MINLPMALGIGLAISAGLVWNAERRLSNAHEEIGRLEAANMTAVSANKSVMSTLAACRLVNANNAQARANALTKASAAEVRAVSLERKLEELTDVAYETDDAECRQLTDPLPGDYVRWLCIASAENCNRDRNSDN